ncbi:MAG: MFS transporter [Chloroflexi bacterium]|nr:MFS transporter [Chloroflexota bacterium]
MRLRAPLPGGWGANAVILAHVFNDMYTPALSVLVPIMALRFGLSLSEAVGLATAYAATSAFLQPLFGAWLDRRRGARLASACSLISAAALAALTLPLPYPLLLAVAAAGGIGNAIFHPHSSALIAGAPGSRQRVMGWYGSTGNLGIGLTPMLLPPLVEWLGGVELTWPWLLLPGAVSVMLLFSAQRLGLRYAQPAGGTLAVTMPFRFATHVLAMVPLLLAIAFRNWTTMGMTALLPLYLGQAGSGWVLGARQVSYMLLGGTVGSVVGGYLAQRFGARRLMAVSLAISSLFLILLVKVGNSPWTGVLTTVGGSLLMMSFALSVVVAQDQLPSHRAYAAGLSFGLGSGLSSLGFGLSGWLAEHLGVAPVVYGLTMLPLLGALVMFGVPKPPAPPGAGAPAPARR